LPVAPDAGSTAGVAPAGWSPPPVACDNACIDPIGVDHCGACGNACGPFSACVNGQCACKDFDGCGLSCACTSGQTRCGSLCADLADDPWNCGGCGRTCDSYQSCVNGACTPADAGVGPPLLGASVDFLGSPSVPAYTPWGGWIGVAPLLGDAGLFVVEVDEAGTGFPGGEYVVFNPTGDGGLASGAFGITPGPTNDNMLLGNFSGLMDLLISNLSSSSLWVLPEVMTPSGPGFGSPIGGQLSLGQVLGSLEMAAADVDGDGRLDLLVDATPWSDYQATSTLEVTVLLGNGDGTFQAPVRSSLGSSFQQGNPFFLADANGDGRPDLFAGGALFLNAGGGRFSTGAVLGPGWIAGIGDFDGDGSPDVAMLEVLDTPGACESSQLHVRYGSASGQYSAGPDFALPRVTTAIAVGDFSGDGKLDLALIGSASGLGRFVALVYAGDGSGGFRADPQTYPLDAEVNNLLPVAADLGGQGRWDLLLWTGGPIQGGNYQAGVEVLPGQ
jgi:hypothetical protein